MPEKPADVSAAGFTGKFAAIVIRARWVLVIGWIAATALVTTTLPDIHSAQTGSLGDLVANDAEAVDAEVRSIELFEFPVLSRTIVVQRRPDGFTGAARARIGERALRIVQGELAGLETIPFALPITNDVGSPIAVGRGLTKATTALTYLFFPLDIGPTGQVGLANRLIDRFIDRGVDGAVGVTGAVPARAEQVSAITDALPLVELATLLLVTLAVGAHYRAFGAPLLNIVAIAISYLASVHLIGGIGQHVGITVPEEVEPIMVALLFGVVTDYSIFFFSRFRGYLRDGVEPRAAAERSTADLTPTIFAAGISVASACAVLVVAQLGFFRAFGPGMALSVLIALAVVTTFLPAALAIFGKFLFWPTNRKPADSESGPRLVAIGRTRDRILALPTSRPVAVAVATVIPLLALSFFVTKLELANTLISGLPSDSETRTTLAQARLGFEPGAISPVMILVEDEEIADERIELRTLQEKLEGRAHVAAVIGPAQLRGPPLTLGAVVSPTGDAVRYLAVLDVNPLGSRAIRTVTRLRRDVPQLLGTSGLGDAKASLAGDTALAEETVVKTEDDLSRILPLATLAVLIVLGIFLRALVAPLYLVASSLLALGASLGLTVLVFQDILSYDELTFYVPFSGIVLLIALGSDYNVYLVGRVWAEARSQPLRRAVAIAGARASTAITIAGLVLAASFSLLAIVPLRPFRELAFILATGLLIDSFIVRSLLAPALITLVGERSAWPGKALRLTEEDAQASDLAKLG